LAKMKEEAKSLREDFLYMDVVHDVPWTHRPSRDGCRSDGLDDTNIAGDGIAAGDGGVGGHRGGATIQLISMCVSCYFGSRPLTMIGWPQVVAGNLSFILKFRLVRLQISEFLFVWDSEMRFGARADMLSDHGPIVTRRVHGSIAYESAYSIRTLNLEQCGEMDWLHWFVPIQLGGPDWRC
jgi:hypothetical protein